MMRTLLISPSEDNPRNSEGSVLQLADNRILLAYSQFYGRCGKVCEDHHTSRIAGRISEDGGRSWSKQDFVLKENTGAFNTMSASLLRLASGEIGLFYLVMNSFADDRCYMRKSSDECRSWGKEVCTMPEPGYFVVNNDRVIQLASGRLLVPAAHHDCPDGTAATFSSRGISTCFISDDNGGTWRGSRTRLEGPAGSRSGLQEPGVVELRDGRVMMLMRTDQGCQFRSYSKDMGETWSRAEPTNIFSPCSPAAVKRIPETGDLVMIWNDHSGIYSGFGESRTPLSAAISRDEGATWSRGRPMEFEPDGCYCYPSIAFTGNAAILSYWVGNTRLSALQVSRVETAWFYED